MKLNKQHTNNIIFLLLVLFIVGGNSVCEAQIASNPRIDSMTIYPSHIKNYGREEGLRDLLKIDSISMAESYLQGEFFAKVQLSQYTRERSLETAWGYINRLDTMLAECRTCYADTAVIKYHLYKGYLDGIKENRLGEIENYLLADSIAKSIDHKKFGRTVKKYLYSYYKNKEEYATALKYINEFGELVKSSDPESVLYKRRIFMYLTIKAELYQELGHHDSVIFVTDEAIKLNPKLKSTLARPYMLLSRAYLDKEDIAKAFYNLEKARTYLRDWQNFKKTEVSMHILSGRINDLLGNIDIAIADFQLAKEIADSVGNYRQQQEANLYLIEAQLDELKRPDIKERLNEYIIATDSIYFAKARSEASFVAAKYESEKKEAEIRRLNLKNSLQKRTNIAIVLSLISLLLLTLYLLGKIRSRKKILAEQLINEQHKKTIAKNELAQKNEKLNQAIDKIKDNVSTIEKLKSDLQKQNLNVNDIEEIIAVLNKNYISENEWAGITLQFDLIHDNYSQKVRAAYPNISVNDMRLLILLKLGYSNKGIAEVNNITEDGVKKAKQRLLKKLDITNFQELNSLGKL